VRALAKPYFTYLFYPLPHLRPGRARPFSLESNLPSKIKTRIQLTSASTLRYWARHSKTPNIIQHQTSSRHISGKLEPQSPCLEWTFKDSTTIALDPRADRLMPNQFCLGSFAQNRASCLCVFSFDLFLQRGRF
jgi:hypothetical protein